jgi:hypothetical protein
MTELISLPTLEVLKAHVHRVLCAHDHLEVSQTPLEQMVMKRRDRVCGLYFVVQGPRLVRNYAVWAGEENRILFYDSSGVRFAECRLSEGPDPLRLALKGAFNK